MRSPDVVRFKSSESRFRWREPLLSIFCLLAITAPLAQPNATAPGNHGKLNGTGTPNLSGWFSY
jgi:hypothetical protein